jgi:hypothetical protein
MSIQKLSVQGLMIKYAGLSATLAQSTITKPAHLVDTHGKPKWFSIHELNILKQNLELPS